ncbi:MAG: DNA polymerase I, partial [Planctomycetota bacterium]|nr:DNA polymerase I [Planctomycetota bacterium]
MIDGHAQIFRAFYAVEGLTAPDGRPSNAIYVFTRMLLDIVNRHNPDYLIAVFDAPGKSFRHERYPEYKSTRRPTPPELLSQIPPIQELVAAYRIPVLSAPGFEADDVIGTLANQATAAGLEVVIVTADKDCTQLLSENVSIWDAQRDRFITKRSFEEEKGIPPHLFPDLIGLWGDSSDNIPGVPGIGEKIAQQLLKKYGSLEEVLAHASEVPGKRGEAVRVHAADARLSRELAMIRRDAPVTLDLETARLHEPDQNKLAAIFAEFGFKSLLANIRGSAATAAADKEKRDYRLVNTAEAFAAFWREIEKAKHLALDTEATALDPMNADLVGISLAVQPRQAWYLPFRGPDGEAVLGKSQLQKIARLLQDPTITKTGQNLKYDLLVLRRAGINLQGIVFDSLLASSI